MYQKYNPEKLADVGVLGTLGRYKVLCCIADECSGRVASDFIDAADSLAFYNSHKVPHLMQKYSGCEDEMYDRICEKRNT